MTLAPTISKGVIVIGSISQSQHPTSRLAISITITIYLKCYVHTLVLPTFTRRMSQSWSNDEANIDSSKDRYTQIASNDVSLFMIQ